MRTRCACPRYVILVAIVCGIILAFAVAFLLGYIPAVHQLSDLSRLGVSDGFVPVSLTIFGRSVDTISARLAFYSQSQDLLGTVERSWAGWELRLECIMISVPSGWLVFPFRLSSDESATFGGVSLMRYYSRSSFPALYDRSVLTDTEERALSHVFSLVQTERWIPPIFGTLHRQAVSIRSFEPGKEYRLFVTRDGTLHLLEN